MHFARHNPPNNTHTKNNNPFLHNKNMKLSRRVLAAAGGVAPEFASTLLQSGRLADLSILNHFMEVATPLPSKAHKEATAASSETVILHDPRAWVGPVFGQDGCMYVSPEAQGKLNATRNSSGQFVVSGTVSAVCCDASQSAAAVATMEDGKAGYFKFSVDSASSSVKSSPQRSGLQCKLDLASHPCQHIAALPDGKSVAEYTSEGLFTKRIAFCYNVSKILESLQHVCALHASSAARYDALLLKDQQAQKTVAQLQCLRFGIDAATSYAESSGHAGDAAMARLYAGCALQTASSAAKMLLGTLVALKDGHHTANPEINIPYRYVGDVAVLAPDLANLDGSTMDVAEWAIGDLLTGKHAAVAIMGAKANPLSQLGGSGRVVRLTSPHLNLSITSQSIEKDATSLLQMLSKKISKSASKGTPAEPMLVSAVGQYVSELFACTTAIYRTTASLQADEEGGTAQRHWLWTQGLCDLSRSRRARILQQLQLDEGAAKSVWSLIQSKDYDEVAVHPVEVGMMKDSAKNAPKKTTAAPAAKASA